MDGDKIVWDGKNSIKNVKSTMLKNNIHCTKYAFMRKGGLFKQNPIKASEGLIPRKSGLVTEKYGGYNESTASVYVIVQYKDKGKKEVMLMPVEYMVYDKFFSNDVYAKNYTKNTLEKVWGREDGQITEICFPMGIRQLKINTVLSFDGFRACIINKANKGQKVGLSSIVPLVIGYEWEIYVKQLDSFCTKKESNKNLILDEKYDEISRDKNEQLYNILLSKVKDTNYSIAFSTWSNVLDDGYNVFEKLTTEEQVKFLIEFVSLLKTGRLNACDFSIINGSKNTGVYQMSSKLSNLKKKVSDVRIIDVSASGIYETCSCNLLELLK
jgi:CRISPR-associated endonuclease Csn1